MRALGAALVALAFLAAGLARASELRRRAELLSALVSALEILGGEISRLAGLDEAAARLARSGPRPVRGFFALFGAGLGRLGELEVSELWDAAARSLPLRGDEYEALSSAGAAWGATGRTSSSQRSRGARRSWRPWAGRAREQSESGRRLYAGAGLAAGLLAAIALY